MIPDPVSEREFKDVLAEVKKEFAEDLYPHTDTLVEVSYEYNYVRFQLFVDGEWDGFEIDTNGLIARIRQLSRRHRREKLS